MLQVYYLGREFRGLYTAVEQMMCMLHRPRHRCHLDHRGSTSCHLDGHYGAAVTLPLVPTGAASWDRRSYLGIGSIVATFQSELHGFAAVENVIRVS